MVAVASSHIERVVVFGNGALISRSVTIPAGVTRAAVDGLPLRLVDDSLRVRPRGEGISVGLVEERCLVQVTSAAKNVDEAAILDVRIALMANAQRRQSIQSLRAADGLEIELPPTDIATALRAEPVLALLTDVGARAEALTALDRTLAEEERALQRTLRDLERQGTVDHVPPKVLRGIEVELTTDAGGTLEVEYFVGAARWVPSYTLQLSRRDNAAHARLILGALVAQATGEDWTDVDLAVSTSTLTRAATLPVVHSWRLGRAQPARLKGYRPLPSDLPTLFSGWEKFPAERRPPPPRAEPAPQPAAKPMRMSSPSPPPAPPRGGPMPSSGAMSMPPGAPPAPMARNEMMKKSKEMSRSRAMDDGAMREAPSMMMMADEVDDDMEEMVAASFGGGGFAPSEPEPVVDELPPRLRTTGMRMVFADEGSTRGLLMPMNARERLAWLLDVADLEADEGEDRQSEVRRAYDAMVAAATRLAQRPLPPGTQGVVGAAARTFSSGSRASIASDGQEHRVEVHREEGPATIVHQAVPREALDVWRLCRFSPGGALPGGPVQVYENDGFVVAGHVDGSAGAAVSFNLGVDPDVRIESRTPHINQSEKGLMSGTSVVEHQVVTVVRSTRAEPVKLTLFDRLPVASADAKDITVSLVASTPPLKQTDRGPDGAILKGGVAVDVTLMPGDTARLEHTYTLSLPAKMEVAGGNRRE